MRGVVQNRRRRHRQAVWPVDEAVTALDPRPVPLHGSRKKRHRILPREPGNRHQARTQTGIPQRCTADLRSCPGRAVRPVGRSQRITRKRWCRSDSQPLPPVRGRLADIHRLGLVATSASVCDVGGVSNASSGMARFPATSGLSRTKSNAWTPRGSFQALATPPSAGRVRRTDREARPGARFPFAARL